MYHVYMVVTVMKIVRKVNKGIVKKKNLPEQQSKITEGTCRLKGGGGYAELPQSSIPVGNMKNITGSKLTAHVMYEDTAAAMVFHSSSKLTYWLEQSKLQAEKEKEMRKLASLDLPRTLM